MAAGDISKFIHNFPLIHHAEHSLEELTDAEIDEIDVAGAMGARRIAAKTYIQRAIGIALAGAAILATCSYLGIDVF